MPGDRPHTDDDTRPDGGSTDDDARGDDGSTGDGSMDRSLPDGGSTDRGSTDDSSTDDGSTDAVSSEEGTHSAAAPGGTTGDEGSGRDGDPEERETGRGPSDRVALALSLLFGLGLAIGAILLVSWLDPVFEGMLRVRPTVPGGGVAADWVAGNADPVLNGLIVLVHLADVVMGLFILVMVFVHWAAFRRLAARMRPPERHAREETAATDGGEPSGGRRTSAGRRSAGDERRERDPSSGGDGGDRR